MPRVRPTGSGRFLPTLALAAGLLLSLALIPAVAAQHAHTRATDIIITHDAPGDGRTYAGNVAHFGVVVLGGDLVPDVHKQVRVQVVLLGVPLFETTADSGHDYDGSNMFDVVFPHAGAYEVHALDEVGEPLASFAGIVEAAAADGFLGSLTASPALTAGVPATFSLVPTDAAGVLVPHSDALVEIWRAGVLQMRLHTHTHDAPQALQYTFPEAGTYMVRATLFQAHVDQAATRLAPTVVELRAEVAPGLPPAPATAKAPSAQARNANVTAGDATYTLVGTFDPYTSVGPATLQHLHVLLMDPATGLPVPHADFAATLTGPWGQTLLASSSLHEYDGILELATVQPTPGSYNLHVEVQKGEWKGAIDLPYTVIPPVIPVAPGVPPQPAVGPTTLAWQPFAATAGNPTGLAFDLHGAAGNPYPHSEVELLLVPILEDGREGPAVLRTKLHTHDGAFEATANFPAEGAYVLRTAPFPLDPQPVTFRGAAGDGALDLHVQAEAGPLEVCRNCLEPAAGVEARAPGPALVIVALAALGLAAARRK